MRLGESMEPEREIALERSQAAMDYFVVLRQAIDEAEQRGRVIHEGLARGESLEVVFAAADAAGVRKQLTDTVAEYERLRHEARLYLMLLAVSQGMSKSAIARAWGISAQWAGHEVEAAQRMAAAAREPEPAP